MSSNMARRGICVVAALLIASLADVACPSTCGESCLEQKATQKKGGEKITSATRVAGRPRDAIAIAISAELELASFVASVVSEDQAGTTPSTGVPLPTDPPKRPVLVHTFAPEVLAIWREALKVQQSQTQTLALTPAVDPATAERSQRLLTPLEYLAYIPLGAGGCHLGGKIAPTLQRIAAAGVAVTPAQGVQIAPTASSNASSTEPPAAPKTP